MKKAFTYICLCAAVVGCSKVDLVSGNSDEDPIVFDNVQTKAIVSGADEILSMGVLAQMNLGSEGDPAYEDYIMLLDNEHVHRANASSPWTYENTRYWVTDRTYHFFAVWPYSGAANSPVTNLSSVATDGAYGYSVTFNTPDAADQELLIAKKTERTVIGNPFPESVDFQFKHQLTNVHFKVWRDGSPEGIDDKVKVKQIVLSNISRKGTYLTTTSPTGGEWRYDPQKMSFTKTYENPGENAISAAQIINGTLTPTDGNNPAVPFGEEGLLLIPHTITGSNSVVVKVVYDYFNNELEDWEEKTLYGFLPEGTWPAGKRLTYNLVISAEKTFTQLLINAVVQEWDRHTEEIDFAQTVTCSAKMEWVPGTYESVDPVNCKVVLYTDKSITATCRFKIDTPVNATWTASLIPLTSSAMDSFNIVEDSKYGPVGNNEWQYVKIQVNNNDPMAPMHACILRITIHTTDGRTIVVRNLVPTTAATGVEEFTIIQNLING